MRIRSATALAMLLAAPRDATAQLFLGGDAEYFNWSEATSPVPVHESGALLGFILGYTQPKPTGLLLAYRGRVYFGAAAYRGAQFFAQDSVIASTTGYLGTEQEVQLRYRTSGRLDVLAALGGDIWRRKLSKQQGEDYRVLFVAAGAEYNLVGPGWTYGARLSYPVWAKVDPHAKSIGFDEDPTLTLGHDLGGSCEVGYRFLGSWALIASFDMMNFKASDVQVISIDGGAVGGLVQPAITTYVIGLKVEFTR